MGVPAGIPRSVAAIGGIVGDGRRLLVLDNFDSVAAGSGTVAGLLDSCRGLCLLVTCRSRLQLRREMVHPVDP